jgi:hypothetical protein
LLEEGDMAGAERWHRILNAIERLWMRVPPDEENAQEVRRPCIAR